MKAHSLFDADQALAIMESTLLADQYKATARENGHSSVAVEGMGSGDVSWEDDAVVVVRTGSAKVKLKELG